MGLRALAVVAWLGMAGLSTAPAFAQPRPDADEDEDGDITTGGAIPTGFDRFGLTDLTYTMRDDTFNTISLDRTDSNVAYVGTHQGRVYKTLDGGRTWTESTVIPEQRSLWAVPGGSIFFGGVRDDGGPSAPPIDQPILGLRTDPIHFTHIPGQLPRFVSIRDPEDPLAGESAGAAGGGRAQLGVGLSDRAPRLQLLVGARGRPAPGTNRGRFLADRVNRGTTITSIAADPFDRRLLFAATVNGLYKSENGGESWTRTFAGLTAGERIALRIAIRPGEPRLMILGTLSGAYQSIDGGENWTKNGTVGGAVNEVAYDMTEAKYVYLATSGGVLRSSDGGQNFDQIYYSTFPAERDVKSMALDPFDPQTLYISTDRGMFVTHKARTAGLDDWTGLEGVQSVQAVPVVAACNHHKGHIVAAVTVKLHTINYGASPPESAVIESWDGGKTWRQLFTGVSDGQVQWFSLDPRDPDTVWMAWNSALHRLERRGGKAPPRTADAYERPDGPALSEIVLAALRHHGLELDDYSDNLGRSVLGQILPSRVIITAVYRQWSQGGFLDDTFFAKNRFLQITDAREWEVMGWATWNLPERVFSAGRVPLMRQRITHVNDELRRQITNTVRRAYGELMRIQATLDSTKLDLQTRVIYRLRAEQLEAVLDLASGDYLARWHKKSRRNAR